MPYNVQSQGGASVTKTVNTPGGTSTGSGGGGGGPIPSSGQLWPQR